MLNQRRKKKKKAKETKAVNSDCRVSEDDIDADIRAVNEMSAEAASVRAVRADITDVVTKKPILFIEHRYLNPDNEVRRLFGTHVMQAENKKRRTTNPHRGTWLARPRDNWPVFTRTGLSMRLVESTDGSELYFVFEHSKSYQKIQFSFLDAVESLNPQNIANLHNEFPFHIDTLLQLSEICKMGDDRQAATELIERALYVFESSFHPLFSLTRGTSRLDYRIAENRPFFLALWRYALTIGRKGCYRTALEYCKLMLSLDPKNDPLCILLLIDFYALRSEQYDFLIRLYDEWKGSRRLLLLPNFGFSVPLAMFHQATRRGQGKDEDEDKCLQSANDMLQNSLLLFPGLLLPLLDKCGIAADRAVQENSYFNSATVQREADGLKQLQMLYVGRCESCWKEPAVMAWLESNVRTIIDKLDHGHIRQAIIDQYALFRSTLYRDTPRNIHRHIVLSEIKEATTVLPPEISLSPILSYDPLPPVDSIAAYKRPERLRRAQESSNPLSLFFRSLAPNFNPQEPVPADEVAAGAAAAGGHDLRHGVTALMDVMRDLLNSIHFIPPPVVNPQDDDNNDRPRGDNAADDDDDDNEGDWN